MEVDAGPQAGLLEDRADDLVGRARVGRRLEHDQHARPQVAGDRRRSAAVTAPRSGPSSSDSGVGTQITTVVGGGDRRLVGRWRGTRAEHLRHVVVAEVVDVRAAGVEPSTTAGVDVEAEDVQPGRVASWASGRPT